MLFLLMQMKLKTVFRIFATLLGMFGLLCLQVVVKEYLYPKVEVPVRELSNQIFEQEIERILSGEEDVEPGFPQVPVMVWWTPFTGDDGVQHCGKHSCYITNDRKFMNHPNLKNIFFYGTSVREKDLPLPRRGLDWSLYHEESPKNNQLFSHEDMIVLFNHTATFRLESDFPLTTQYLEDLEGITEPRHMVPIEEKNRFLTAGNAPVVYVQSGCDCPSQRDLWVHQLMKHIQVDSYGSCLHNKDLPAELNGSEQFENREFYKLLSKYKFMITFENAICDDYVTEKLWRALKLGVVPIYLGAPNIDKYLPNPHSIVSVQNFSTVEEVAAIIKQINEDDKLYMTFLKHKTQRQVENQLLKQLVNERSWGVSTRQQLELGNSVRHFQCLVCNRMAENAKYQTMGFGPVRYSATVSHYGCPIPTNPLTKKADREEMFVRDWFRTKYAAELLREFSGKPSVVSEQEFNDLLLQRWKLDLQKEQHQN